MKKLVLTLVLLILGISFRLFAPVSPPVIPILAGDPLYKNFQNYVDDLGFKESGNDIYKINRIGCFGEHQWRQSTLARLGYKDITLKKFKKDPAIFPRKTQIAALKALIEVNKTLLEPYESYIGRSIKGIRITESGLQAACHLGGFGSVRKFLESGGRTNETDIFGTSIKDYLREFQGYRLDL